MRANSRALALAGALVLLLAALVATTSDGPEWAGISGGSEIQTPDRSSAEDDSSGAGGESRDDPAPETEGDSPSVATRTIAVAILVVAVIALMVVGAVVGLRIAVRRRKFTETMRPRTITETEDEPDPEPPETLADGVADGLSSVIEGSPRNAIVATWVRLVEATVAAGFEQRGSETPTEFVRRALTAYPVDEHAIGRLADLYREARFSKHQLTEEHRDEALSCLCRLHEQLTRLGAR